MPFDAEAPRQDEYQPRYRAFMNASPSAGRRPNYEFMWWVRQQWRQWASEHGEPADGPRSDAHHASFDAMLAERFPPMPLVG